MKKYLSLLLIVFAGNLYANNTNGAYGELLLGRGYNHLGEQVDGSNSNDWVLSGKLGLGYKIDTHIGLEVGYEQFGQRRFNNIGGTSAFATTNEYAVELQTILHFALNDNFSLIGKIGPAYVQATQNIKDADSITTNKYQSSSSTWRPDYAVGASYLLDDFPGLELTAMYSHIVNNNIIPDTDLYMGGLIFNF